MSTNQTKITLFNRVDDITLKKTKIKSNLEDNRMKTSVSISRKCTDFYFSEKFIVNFINLTDRKIILK